MHPRAPTMAPDFLSVDHCTHNHLPRQPSTSRRAS
jgi:hypothetical protein